MKFRTEVAVPQPGFKIKPCERMLFVGSCFADEMGRRFVEEKFRVVANPYGVMYNPVSVLHTVESVLGDEEPFATVVITLGTNHVYREKATGAIVDNCRKRPQQLFEEQELTVAECARYLLHVVNLLRQHNPLVNIVFTVSPIRYAKYGYHASRLSKATLLLAVEEVLSTCKKDAAALARQEGDVYYFPAYEIVDDELRDYRFYKPDMLHPSEQAVEYIYDRFAEACFSDAAKAFLEEWKPLKAVLAHRPFDAESAAYRELMEKTRAKMAALAEKYPDFR